MLKDRNVTNWIGLKNKTLCFSFNLWATFTVSEHKGNGGQMSALTGCCLLFKRQLRTKCDGDSFIPLPIVRYAVKLSEKGVIMLSSVRLSQPHWSSTQQLYLTRSDWATALLNAYKCAYPSTTFFCPWQTIWIDNTSTINNTQLMISF